MVVEIRRRLYRMPSRFASSADMEPRQHGPCQLARFCSKRRTLLPHASSAAYYVLVAAAADAASGAAIARGHTRCRSCARANRQRWTLSQTDQKTKKNAGLQQSRGKLGQSKAPGEFSVNRMQRSNMRSHVTHIWLCRTILSRSFAFGTRRLNSRLL